MLNKQAIEMVCTKIDSIYNEKKRVIIALDGRCCSGKTTFAGELQKKYNCNLIHMDDFFLRPEQRTAKRYSTPGGNVDYERFLEEILIPVSKGESFIYRKFDCKLMKISEGEEVNFSPITIVEGSYSCHPDLRNYYDLKIFLDINAQEQTDRIINRNGIENAQIFKEKWIPLEELYFKECGVMECCDVCIEMNT